MEGLGLDYAGCSSCRALHVHYVSVCCCILFAREGLSEMNFELELSDSINRTRFLPCIILPEVGGATIDMHNR